MIEVVMHSPAAADLLDTAPTLEAAVARLVELAWEEDDAVLLRTTYTFRDVETGAVQAVGYYQKSSSPAYPDLFVADLFVASRSGIDVYIYRAGPNPEGGADVVRVPHAEWGKWCA